MAVAVVQATAGLEGVGVTSLAATFVNPTTAGNTFVACAAVFDSDGVAPTPFSTADSKSNTYTKARNQAFGADAGNDACQLQQDYSAGGTAGSSHQITVTPGDTVNMTLGILELSGVDTTNPVATNGTGGTIGSGTAVATPTVTPTQAGLGLGQMGYDAGAKTITSNWTGANQELEIDENNDAQDQSLLSKQFTASGADAAAWTLSGSAAWGAQLVVYRPAGAAAAVQRKNSLLRLGVGR
jgi:hypothetical protein